MSGRPSPQPFFIRLYGGAEDDGILEIPMVDGHIPIALKLPSGHYYNTGLWDNTGIVLFAYAGTEGALLLRPGLC